MTTLLLDIMRHDISNANNVANLYADLLATEIEEEAEAELLRRAKAGLAKSIEIVRDVNTIQHIEGGLPSPGPVDLDRIIRAEIERSPGARITYTGRPVEVLADDLLSEVFTNLIGNAVKFGGPEVGITIRVEELGEEVVVSVEDDGPGIPDAVKPRLFDRLSRGTYKKSGTGLGLYICRMLITRYGGEIRVEDRPEGGTAIRFSLRRAGTGGEP